MKMAGDYEAIILHLINILHTEKSEKGLMLLTIRKILDLFQLQLTSEKKNRFKKKLMKKLKGGIENDLLGWFTPSTKNWERTIDR